MSLDTLPPELYECILGHVPPLELQQTILSITRAIPLSPVPISQLFHSIRITHPLQAIHLYRRLRPRSTKELDADGKRSSSSSPETAWVKEVFIEAWSVDANVIVNLLRLLPEIKLLSIWIGPENFAPEHLEELFQKPLSELTFLSLRFRPYVQKATYYQFLKGAYFDSTLLALSRWPSSTLPTISIVQDPLDPNILQKQTFAQPLVFFRLDSCISSLLHSPALAPSLTSLRLRIPSRPIARSLSVITAHGSPSDLVKPANIEFLDISTSVVLETELDTLLARLTSLKHIILDGCAILRGDLYEVEWNALGKRCALVGVRRAKEREKALKTWLEERSTATGGGSAQVIARPKPKPGRKGLSTATISFRDPDPITAPPTSTLNTLLEGGSTAAGGGSSTATTSVRDPDPGAVPSTSTSNTSVKGKSTAKGGSSAQVNLRTKQAKPEGKGLSTAATSFHDPDLIITPPASASETESGTATDGGGAQVPRTNKGQKGRRGLSTTTTSVHDSDPITMPPASSSETGRITATDGSNAQVTPRSGKGKQGRKGLSTATALVRDKEPTTTPPAAASETGRITATDGSDAQVTPRSSKGKQGRKGLSTATALVRDPEPTTTPAASAPETGRITATDGSDAQVTPRSGKGKQGRKGLSTATALVRDPEPTTTPPAAASETGRITATHGSDAQVPRPGKAKPGRKGLSTATISFHDPKPIAASPASTSQIQPPNPVGGPAKKAPRKVRVLPPLPTLLSLSTTLSPAIQVDKYPAIRAAFEAGWAEGIVQLSVTRARLRTSAGNGFRVMRLASAAETSADDAEYEDGLEGLVDVDNTDPEAFGMIGEDGSVLDLKVPVLCFSGAKRDADIKHEDNCGHSVGWKVMGDEM